ncbi:hypothetical protein GOBAR_AA35845 [Gossypium barbadense]|uniref:Uncharacterized protein n=1 Tax=Gossypium barbadense TaxID=3634 RepID=A0A2P5W1A0_GOSBA|nr:hypothetical protein GOBAR_AA35845 [Gossypium barbadense]
MRIVMHDGHSVMCTSGSHLISLVHTNRLRGEKGTSSLKDIFRTLNPLFLAFSARKQRLFLVARQSAWRDTHARCFLVHVSIEGSWFGGFNRVLLFFFSVIAGVRIGQGSKNTSSGIDILSREHDEVMNIDSLVGSARKKRKATTGARFISLAWGLVQAYPYNPDIAAFRWQALVLEAIRLSSMQLPPASGLCSSLQFFLSEVNYVGLRCEKTHYKELIDLKAELVRVNKQRCKMMEENETMLKRNEDLMKCLAIVETTAKGLEREVATKKESMEAQQAELDRFTEEHVAKTDRIIRECQDQMEGMIRGHFRVFEDFKKKTTENVLSSISKLKMNILLHAQLVAVPLMFTRWILILSKRGYLDFYIKEDPSTDNSVVPSAANNDVTPSGDVCQGVDRVTQLGAVNPQLVLYFGKILKDSKLRMRICSGSSPVNLNIIAGSFALANCFGDYGSSPANLNMKTESFALINCFGGYDYSIANLNMIAGSFAPTNYFRGCGSSLVNLNMTIGSFVLANCFDVVALYLRTLI